MSARPSPETLRHELRELKPELADEYQIETLALFGSYLRQEQRPGSDLDLLVTFREPPGMFRSMQLENYLSDRLGVKVDLVMRSALKPRIGQSILREAEPI